MRTFVDKATRIDRHATADGGNQVVVEGTRQVEASIVASYLAILVGCAIKDTPQAAKVAKELVPKSDITPLLDQLNEFVSLHKPSSDEEEDDKIVEAQGMVHAMETLLALLKET
mmetsp:Transcript_60123/g.130589  ORF Transcript_60123/g.130589 Transcript_60123/m.130589 type:complete len:114 (+) Transcript_60123:275-616(+)